MDTVKKCDCNLLPEMRVARLSRRMIRHLPLDTGHRWYGLWSSKEPIARPHPWWCTIIGYHWITIALVCTDRRLK